MIGSFGDRSQETGAREEHASNLILGKSFAVASSRHVLCLDPRLKRPMIMGNAA